MSYILRQMIPSNSGEPIVIHITEDEVHVGRNKIIHLTKFPQVSRDHAVFYKSDNGTLFVKDLNSLNGIFVNDVKIGSSLTRLSIGDVIGFGVTSALASEGFVCTLSCHTTSTVKHEVIDLSDDDMPETVIDSVRKLNSENSDIQVSAVENRNASDSHNENTVISLDKTENLSVLHKIKNSSEPHIRSTLRSKNNHNVLLTNTIENYASANNYSNLSIPNSVQNISSVPSSNSCSIKKESVETMLAEKCNFPIVKCKSEDFKCSSDVKIPFCKESEHNKHTLDVRRKQVKKLNPESLHENYERRVLASTSFSGNQNADLVLSNKDNEISDNQSYNENATSGKRKLSNISYKKTLAILPTSSKKNDSIKKHISDHDSEAEAKSRSHEVQHNFNEVSYSQIEEIIYISDDELYLDFKSSQNYVQIKEEPEEMEDPDNDMYKVFERENNYEFECSSDVMSNKFSPKYQEMDNRVESVESIRAFVNCSEKNSLELVSNSCNEINVTSINSLPVSSQNTDIKEDDFPVTVNKTMQKSTGKILLIDPKPMSYRPRRLRGRDEGFVEKMKCVDMYPSSKTKKCVKRISCSKKQSLGEKETSDSSISKLKTPCNSKCKDFMNELPENQCSNFLELASTSSSFNSPSKKKTVKTRPEKFCSRMQFLVNEGEINAQGGHKRLAMPEIYKSKRVSKKNKDQPSVIKDNNVSEGNKDFLNKNVQNTRVSTSDSVNKFVNIPQPYNGVIATKCATKCKTEAQKRTTDSSYSHVKEGKLLKTCSSEVNSFTSTNVSERTNLFTRNDSLPSKLSFDSLIKDIIKLNTKWLQEQTAVKAPPLAVSKGAADLPLCFKSYDSYVASFYPMLMLEIWEYMYTESKEVYASNKQYKKFYFSILSYTSREDCIELKCESVVAEKVCFSPREGVIAVLELKENSRRCSPSFGYIYKHKVEPLNLNSLKISHWKNLPEEWLRNARHWTFYTYIRKKEISFELNTLMKGNGLCYIRSKLRLADALNLVKDSPLLRDILQPREFTFSNNYAIFSPTREYTSSQTGIIKCISDEINKPYQQPKVVLLQGPPGTGKTHTIIGFLEKLFYNSKYKSKHKILVTAPSDVAIDEIGCHLIELNERSGWQDNSIKFVRVGLYKQVHPKMMPYFLDYKAKEMFQQNSSARKWKESELQSLLSEINKLEMDHPSKDRNERLKYLKDQCKYLQEQSFVKNIDYNTEMIYKATILKESHIILCTLSSCGLSILLRTFKPNSNICFSCCIIDEATQCTELDILQPLVFGISKLILVGDPEQLPAYILSKLASQYGLERSMFERFYLYFQRLNKNPVITLTEQFRMHSAICEFPSKQFYAQKLVTHPDISLRYKEFPFEHYILLNILSESSDPSSKVSSSETSVILNICKFLINRLDSTSSIGIITAYQAQRLAYMKALYYYPQYKEIEINIVNAFQGREKDIIVLSSLNASNHSEGVSFLSSKRLLNVAITRARKCLIICAQTTKLMFYPDWRMLIHDAQERNLCIPVKSPKDIPSVLRDCMKKK